MNYQETENDILWNTWGKKKAMQKFIFRRHKHNPKKAQHQRKFLKVHLIFHKQIEFLGKIYKQKCQILMMESIENFVCNRSYIT